MANNDATEEEVIAASRIAGVSEFIELLPDGYRAWIGQQGLRFSGGQRQRLSLARAILRNPSFLMLDEAMNALDRGLDERVRSAINDRFAGRTILIITHRVEAVLNADHVIHIEDGMVVGQGSPEVLLADAGNLLSIALVRERPPIDRMKETTRVSPRP